MKPRNPFRVAADLFDPQPNGEDEVVDRYLAALAASIAGGDPLPMPERSDEDGPEAWSVLVAFAREWDRSQSITGGA
jgi:hypothetical protein